jgi:uncharacterized protein
MTSAFIIHGRCNADEYYSSAHPSLSNNHWLPWLQKQLLMRNIFTQTPEMPQPCRPIYSEWATLFNRLVYAHDDLFLIGHSCGAGFLLRWLSETGRAPVRTVLVAPWLNPLKKGADDDFFNFTIDHRLPTRTDLHILASDNDGEDVMQSVRIIRAALPDARYHLFEGYGHFCLSDMKTDRFPDLLTIVAGDTPIATGSGARPGTGQP